MSLMMMCIRAGIPNQERCQQLPGVLKDQSISTYLKNV